MRLYERLSGKEVIVNEIEKPNYTKNYLFKIYLAHHLVRNLKDLPVMYMILNNVAFTCISVPIVWYFQNHFMGFIYLVINYGIFFGRYMCLNHEYAHTQIFTNKKLGHFLTIFLLGQSHGLPVGSYYINHVIMHHKGANVWNVDLSSTEKYDRESIIDFFIYWIRHYSLFGFVYDCIIVCLRYGRKTIALGYGLIVLLLLLMELYFFLYTKYSVGSLYTMILPMFITGFFGAVGGWMQHFFLHPTKPRKWYSYDIINSYANTHGFNQGFHNTHHTLGNLHWTELPSGFQTLLQEYDKDDVMIIQLLENIQVFLLVMSKRYDILAKYLVTTKAGGQELGDCIKYIRNHLKPIN